jgi:hypothetical protein
MEIEMRVLSASELLNVWERGLSQPPIQRALLLLAAASPEMAAEELARLSIGQRDAQLLRLREWTFGTQLASLVKCAQCGERLELTFDMADLQAPTELAPTGNLSLQVEGYDLRFRLPNSLDLTTIKSDEMANSRGLLLQRCILASTYEGEEKSVEQLPENIVQVVMERMSQAEPQADIQIAVACPACRHEWQANFDIVSFFWSEITAWAQRLLREIHTLAAVYHWREADILALSPWRRQCYLEMVSR